MSVRITESMRNTITHHLLKHRFEKPDGVLKRKEHELAMKVYRLFYDAPTRRQMEALPDGWLPTDSRVRVSIKNIGIDLFTSNPVPVLALDQHGYIKLEKLRGAERLTLEINQLQEEKKSLEKSRCSLRQQTASTIASFGSIKRLVDAWPEIKPFTDRLGYDDAKKSLPAVIPAGLNSSLGLPISG